MEIPKKYNCEKLLDDYDVLYVKYQVENCIYWNNNNMKMFVMYNCDRILKDY